MANRPWLSLGLGHQKLLEVRENGFKPSLVLDTIYCGAVEQTEASVFDRQPWNDFKQTQSKTKIQRRRNGLLVAQAGFLE